MRGLYNAAGEILRGFSKLKLSLGRETFNEVIASI